MRFVFAILSVMMALALLVQYNDADGPIWIVIYGVAAIWAGVAAWRPHLLASRTGRPLLLISLATALILTVMLWPPVPGWWRADVWSMEMAANTPAGRVAEMSREGMGLMIVTLVLILTFAWSLAPPSRPGSSARLPA
jgi:hypothetical protein